MGCGGHRREKGAETDGRVTHIGQNEARCSEAGPRASPGSLDGLSLLTYAATRRRHSAWVEGDDFANVRDKTGLETEQAAVRLVRAAIATLRRRFSDE